MLLLPYIFSSHIVLKQEYGSNLIEFALKKTKPCLSLRKTGFS